ncbi:hypothetical protein Tco_0674932 [Tanacetum coccineum]
MDGITCRRCSRAAKEKTISDDSELINTFKKDFIVEQDVNDDFMTPQSMVSKAKLRYIYDDIVPFSVDGTKSPMLSLASWEEALEGRR